MDGRAVARDAGLAGSLPSADERQALLEIARPVSHAIAIAITRPREVRAAEYRRPLAQLQGAVAELTARLHRLEPGRAL